MFRFKEETMKNCKTTLKNAALLSAVAVTCTGLTGCGNKISKISRYIDDADYEEALDVYYNWNISEKDEEKLASVMLEKLTQAVNDFAAGTIDYEQAMDIYNTVDQMYLDEISEDKVLALSQIGVIRTSKENFALGEEAFSNEDYLLAANYYNQVSDLDGNYDSAVKKAEEAVKKYTDGVIETAREYAENGDYNSAYNILMSASYNLEDPSALNEELTALHKEQALENAKAYAEENNYGMVFETLDNFKNNFDSDDSEVNKAYDNYVDDYVTEIIEQADSLRLKRQYLTAIELVEDAQYVLENSEFDGMLEKLRAEKPVYLEDLELKRSSNYGAFDREDVVTDVAGNTYTGENIYEIAAKPAEGWGSDEFGNAEYLLGGQYSLLTGTVAVENTSGEQITSLIIEGDGNELYRQEFNQQSAVEKISVDVSGVDSLKIRLDGFGGSGKIFFILSDFILK